MCTLALLRRPEHDWPLIIAANRDEMRDRPWQAPGRHWPERPEVTAGLDVLAGGSWLGRNDHGVVAGILNRVNTLGPEAGKRSRGELVLDALDYADAADAAAALSDLDPAAYRPFNLIIADSRDAFWLAHRGTGPITAQPIAPGLAMITARDLNDPASPRVRRYAPRFAEAAVPDPERGDFTAWEALLADTATEPGAGAETAMRFMLPMGFGTVSSAIIAIPAHGRQIRPVWRFTGIAGQPSPWVTLGPA